ncbi:MAG: universal stress protein [Betaproteobacteria bacterium]|nr:MAG: universal stress protein [Betaproteobacteria bacterium]
MRPRLGLSSRVHSKRNWPSSMSSIRSSWRARKARCPAKSWLRWWSRTRKRCSISSPLQFLRRGAPASEILSVAKEWRADLIVVGTHGQGGVARLLVGSVAEAVLRHAICPVLVSRLHA